LHSAAAADQSVITRWVACLLQSQLPFQEKEETSRAAQLIRWPLDDFISRHTPAVRTADANRREIRPRLTVGIQSKSADLKEAATSSAATFQFNRKAADRCGRRKRARRNKSTLRFCVSLFLGRGWQHVEHPLIFHRISSGSWPARPYATGFFAGSTRKRQPERKMLWPPAAPPYSCRLTAHSLSNRVVSSTGCCWLIQKWAKRGGDRGKITKMTSLTAEGKCSYADILLSAGSSPCGCGQLLEPSYLPELLKVCQRRAASGALWCINARHIICPHKAGNTRLRPEDKSDYSVRLEGRAWKPMDWPLSRSQEKTGSGSV
jgi:hypothetical protein